MLFHLIEDETGATAIEYALIAVLIAVACISAMASLGNEVLSSFDTIAATIKEAVA